MFGRYSHNAGHRGRQRAQRRHDDATLPAHIGASATPRPEQQQLMPHLQQLRTARRQAGCSAGRRSQICCRRQPRQVPPAATPSPAAAPAAVVTAKSKNCAWRMWRSRSGASTSRCCRRQLQQSAAAAAQQQQAAAPAGQGSVVITRQALLMAGCYQKLRCGDG